MRTFPAACRNVHGDCAGTCDFPPKGNWTELENLPLLLHDVEELGVDDKVLKRTRFAGTPEEVSKS